MGAYTLDTYVEGEKPDIYYECIYRKWNKSVLFEAYYEDTRLIKKHAGGGNGLSESEKKKEIKISTTKQIRRINTPLLFFM
jgi:hypothetical protein